MDAIHHSNTNVDFDPHSANSHLYVITNLDGYTIATYAYMDRNTHTAAMTNG